MAKKLLLPFVFIATLLSMTSCDEEEVIICHETIALKTMQTQCSDPWGSSSDDDELKNLVESYLDQQGVEVISIDIETDESQVIFCAACTCGTGKTIIVNVVESDRDTLEDMGFVE